MPRHAKPTALKELAGNPGKRPLNENEPVYLSADTKPPEWLTDSALLLWNKYAAALDANEMLNTANREFLGTYCQLMAEIIDSQYAGEPIDIKKLQQIRLIAREFGFTPSSQSGIAIVKKEKADDRESYFN